MSDLILHHYDEAPFAEKIRLIFGIKGLSWQSVIIPAAMPKPDLIPLTGGYRRTPVLQIGADIFCDTQLIASELERRYPKPTIFPDGNPGLAYALGSWAHGPYVVSAVAIYMGSDDPFAGNIPLPRHFYEDRKKMWRSQFDTDTLLSPSFTGIGLNCSRIPISSTCNSPTADPSSRELGRAWWICMRCGIRGS